MLEIPHIHTSKPGTNNTNSEHSRVQSQLTTANTAPGRVVLAGSKATPSTPYSLYHRSHSLSLAEGQMAVFDNLVINSRLMGSFPSPSHITLCLGHVLSLFHLWAPSPLPTLCLPLSLCPALSSMANSSLQAMFKLLLSLPAPDL